MNFILRTENGWLIKKFAFRKDEYTGAEVTYWLHINKYGNYNMVTTPKYYFVDVRIKEVGIIE